MDSQQPELPYHICVIRDFKVVSSLCCKKKVHLVQDGLHCHPAGHPLLAVQHKLLSSRIFTTLVTNNFQLFIGQHLVHLHQKTAVKLDNFWFCYTVLLLCYPACSVYCHTVIVVCREHTMPCRSVNSSVVSM